MITKQFISNEILRLETAGKCESQYSMINWTRLNQSGLCKPVTLTSIP